jgi:hypothetical protein
MAIAQAIEERNCLRAEMDLASRRFRKFIYAAHAQALRAERLATEYATASQQVVSSVQGVVKGCSTNVHKPQANYNGFDFVSHHTSLG